jgi:hypothetical protein
MVVVDSQLAKLKPTERRPIESALTEAWTQPVGPCEVLLLYHAWDQYHNEGLTYRGQAAQEKKIQNLLVMAAEGPGSESDFEELSEDLVHRQLWPQSLKVLEKLCDRYPRNPLFPFLKAVSEYRKNHERLSRRVLVPLQHARQLAKTSENPRHRVMLDRIDQFHHEIHDDDLFDELFDFFSSRRGRS